MSHRILIVEDNEGVAGLLEELVRGLGARSQRVSTGSQALALLGESLPDAVILDLVLGDLDGFQVANRLRELPRGDQVPLVVTSGVFKKLPDAFAERARPHFLPKPFDPSALRTLLSSLLKLQPPAAVPRPDSSPGGARPHGGEDGDFLAELPAAVLLRLCGQRENGVLDAVQGEVRRRLVLQAGQVRYAQSNVLAENAGGRQVATGQLSREAFDRAVAHARTARVSLPEALATTGVLSEAVLADALRQQTAEVVSGFLSMEAARWSFTPGDPTLHPEARRHPVELVLEYVRRTTSASDAQMLLSRRADGGVQRSPLLEREAFVVRTAWPGEGVTALLSSKPSLRELIDRVRQEDLPFLWALLSSGLAQVEVAGPVSEAAPPEEDPDAGRTFSPKEEQARAFIFAEVQRFASLDHYALLGVPQGAPPDVCRRAYLQLARRYHSDAYAGLDLGYAGQQLAHLFQRLNEAMETLTDEGRRAEYDIFLDRKAKGLPTDVGAILEAEGLFQRGEVLVKLARWQEAHDHFERAVQLNHAEPEFHVYLALTAWRLKLKSPEQARNAVLEALEQSPKMAGGHAVLGVLARDTEDDKKAREHLRRALELDPHHELALAEMRTLNLSKDKNDKSLLGRLFGR